MRLTPLLRRSAVAVAVTFLGSPVAAQSPSRGITAEDYFAFEFAGDPRISPDGQWVTYTVTHVDQKLNRRRTTIWLTKTDGTGTARQLTPDALSASAPRWSPDGSTIAFIATPPSVDPPMAGPARPQIWLVPAAAGDPKKLTSIASGLGGCVWSPDGNRFACISRTGPSDSRAPSSDVRHYSHIDYKFNDTGWFDDKRGHIWIIDAKSGNATQLTSGEDWNDADPQWSPDGSRIAFVSDRTGHEFDEGNNTDVWVIPAAGGSLTKISDHAEADNSPRWSADGKTIAFVGRVAEKDPPQIWTAPTTGGVASTKAAAALDLIPTELTWADGNSLMFATGVKGELQVYRLDLTTRAVAAITSGPRGIRAFSVSDRAKTMVYLANDFRHLDDVYTADLSGAREKKLTSLNAALWAQRELASVERVAYKGADGWPVDGFLVKPIGWQAGTKYPLILSVHGGPAGQYGVDWYHEFQVYAAHGWAVFFCNPRGSTGYGLKFERGIENEWGGKDYIDIMNGVNAAIAANPWIDTTRMGVTGGSYGGYMTNWVVTHTNRFKAAVTLRSISNFISDDGTRDGAYGHADDFGGDIFQKHELYWDRSPLKFAANARTPILILHSDNDFRVPIEQGEQFFRALKHFNKAPAEIVFFPRENHNLTRTGEPKHLVESLNWQLYWFDKYVDGKTNVVAPDMR